MSHLLISVANPSEMQLAMESGVPWVDLKDPERGSLGMASRETQSACLRAAGIVPGIKEARRSRILSIACGELSEMVDSSDSNVPDVGWQYAKLGLSRLSQCDDWVSRWQSWANRLPGTCRPVVVAYADWYQCDGLRLEQAIRFARQMNCRHVLIDTFDKQSGDLFSCLQEEPLSAAPLSKNGAPVSTNLPTSVTGPVKALEGVRLRVQDALLLAREFQQTLVWAGRLNFQQAQWLWQWGAQTVGLRSAVCDKGRTGSLSAQCLKQAMDLEHTVGRKPLGTLDQARH